MDSRMLEQKTDLTNCDREPIHIPGSVQPHGVLLALKEPELTLLQVSENIVDLIGHSAQSVLNRPLDAIFETPQVYLLKKALLSQDLEAINPIKLRIKTTQDELLVDGVLHRTEAGILVLELEVSKFKESTSFVELYSRIKSSLTRLQHATDLGKLYQVAAQEIRKLTGFDRVMIYQFDKQWNGVVVAEDKLADLDPFFGLHFPASDIPAQARELYRKNFLRLISNVNDHPAALQPPLNPLTQQPLDLSHAVLRSVSPMHIEYLKNMGVGASMSVSLLKDNTLWGLISCHHLTPKYIQHEIRSACELLGQVISNLLVTTHDYEEHNYEMQVKSTQTRLTSNLVKEDNVFASLVNYEADLLQLVNAQGLAICFEDKIERVGQVPTETDLQQLVDWLKTTVIEDVFYTNHLAERYQGAASFKDVGSGLLAVPISRLQGTYILWFRPEVIQTVTWGGNPDEGVKVGASIADLHPRQSFEQWKQTISMTSLPWKRSELQAVSELRSTIVDLVLQNMVLRQTLGSWLRHP